MDIYYIFAIVVFIASLIIQARLKSTFAKYSQVMSIGGYTADQAAAKILSAAEVNGLTIRHISGELTDNYNPKEGTINLSDAVYGQRSIAAIAVAAHECGHAIQDSRNLWYYELRQLLAPVAGIAAKAGVYIAILGLLIAGGANAAESFQLYNMSYSIMTIGIVIYSASFFFYLVMVPVEYDASNRALKIIKEMGLVGEDQVRDCKKVLRAAGRTYVIALASSGVTLMRLLAMRGRRRR